MPRIIRTCQRVILHLPNGASQGMLIGRASDSMRSLKGVLKLPFHYPFRNIIMITQGTCAHTPLCVAGLCGKAHLGGPASVPLLARKQWHKHGGHATLC